VTIRGGVNLKQLRISEHSKAKWGERTRGSLLKRGYVNEKKEECSVKRYYGIKGTKKTWVKFKSGDLTVRGKGGTETRRKTRRNKAEDRMSNQKNLRGHKKK